LTFDKRISGSGQFGEIRCCWHRAVVGAGLKWPSQIKVVTINFPALFALVSSE